MQDVIWDKYSNEQILVEFFAHQLSNNKEAKADFDKILSGEIVDCGEADKEEIYDWFESQIAKNKEELEKEALDIETENISFKPGD